MNTDTNSYAYLWTTHMTAEHSLQVRMEAQQAMNKGREAAARMAALLERLQAAEQRKAA